MTYKPKFQLTDHPLYEPGVRYQPGHPVPTALAGMIPAGRKGNGGWADWLAPKWMWLEHDAWEDAPVRMISREVPSRARFLPDEHIYHMTVMFPDGQIQDPSVPLGMLSGYKKDYVMAKELQFTASTPEQLSEYMATSMADGTRVRVTSLDCIFVLDKCSQALADGLTVINTRTMGAGRWIRKPADDRPVLSPQAAAIYGSYIKSDQSQPDMTNVTGAYQIVAPRGALIGVSGQGSIEFIRKAISGTKGRGLSVLVVPEIHPSANRDGASVIGCAELTMSSSVPNLWDVLRENKTANLAIVDPGILRLGNLALASRLRELKDLRVAIVHHSGNQYFEQNVDIDIRCGGLSWTYAKHRYAKERVNGVYFPI